MRNEDMYHYDGDDPGLSPEEVELLREMEREHLDEMNRLKVELNEELDLPDDLPF